MFENINLTIHSGDRIGLIGPNGSGKSTLLKIICERIVPDKGKVVRRKNISSSYLAQADTFLETATIEENLDMALESLDIDDNERRNRVQILLSRAGFPDSSIAVSLLSGGWRKRLAICQSLVLHPDVLVLDEPTNHLDIEGVIWLEKILSGALPGSPEAVVIVSHDRRFLENFANRMVEVSAVYPEGTLQAQGNYSNFLSVRAEFLAHQEQLEERLANKMRRENEWLSRGPKARATKARYRIDEAHRLQTKLSEVKERNRVLKKVRIDFEATGRKTRKLLEAVGIAKEYDGRQLFKNLDMVLSPGSRLGLLGRNGCGKSTLMKILAGALQETGVKPDSGTINIPQDIKIVSFDQKRDGVDQSLTLRRALAPDGDSIVFRDSSVHVASWARRFLFRPDQLETPVSQLSGGEQARILIAELMRQPADILLLDEPTNDLDIPSLDVLEESLEDFPGAIVLVSHDRFLLDAVCDQILGFDNLGGASYFADYEQWLNGLRAPEESGGDDGQGPEGKEEQVRKKQSRAGKLSYMDQREYDQMEEKIMEAEERKEYLQGLLDDHASGGDTEKLAATWKDMEGITLLIEQMYERWDELEEKKLSDQ